MTLQLPFFLDASSVERVIVNVWERLAICILVKTLLTQWETEEENQIDLLMKNLQTQWVTEEENRKIVGQTVEKKSWWKIS